MHMIIETNIDVKNSKEESEDKLTLKSKETYAKVVIGNDANVISEKANIQNNSVNGNLPILKLQVDLIAASIALVHQFQILQKTEKSILIVEPHDDPIINTKNTTKAIKKLVVSNGISIKNFYKHKN